MPSLAPWLRALPICLLAMGIYQPLNSWCVRKKQFKAIAASRIGQAGTTAVGHSYIEDMISSHYTQQTFFSRFIYIDTNLSAS